MSERRLAVVTAAAGAGIGSATAEQLLEDGFDVVLTDVHERRCKETAARLSEGCGRPVECKLMDVSDRQAVNAVIGEIVRDHERIDALVNNAGFNQLEPLLEMSPESWDTIIAINLTGTFNCIRAVAPSMAQRGSGAIVNVSSAAAWESSTEDGIAYPASKAGMLGLTRAAAADLGRYGVRVNAVAPGLIYNEFLRRIYPADFFDRAEATVVLGRLGTPADVAKLISFLASDRASYITGEVYAISGGQSPHA